MTTSRAGGFDKAWYVALNIARPRTAMDTRRDSLSDRDVKEARWIGLRRPIAAIDMKEWKAQLTLLHCTAAHGGGGGGGAPRHGGLDLERLCTVQVPQSICN